ncbi:ferritin-like domain-containing protein [Methylomonas albis]|uniref:Ferritin-like domain-containing protein n=1 Tax=Methylomonas albis TaxID=1854563 RepID=A0ABR9CZR3_9GAMM|nr:ferritin-like domain-containing protein [Methylomonas albis]MBD9356371.1 ferritin-like domain-containing protein [Methylomonas albis]
MRTGTLILEEQAPCISDFAARCLFNSDIAQKLVLTHQARQLLDNGLLSLQAEGAVLPISHTLFPSKPDLLMPRDMPKRRLDSDAGKAAFFHALAHIEFVAIYLAWDIIYRFRGLPDDFYRDWLIIADEEAQHFELIRDHLLGLGFDYGDLPAHRGLWSHAEETSDDILARLAIVPRCMEARGLDVTPAMMDKLNVIGDQPGVAILTRIYNDEVGHVERGSYWFNILAKQRGLQPEQCFKDLIMNYFKGKPKGPFNREVRIIAGFSNNEIDWLEERLHE